MWISTGRHGPARWCSSRSSCRVRCSRASQRGGSKASPRADVVEYELDRMFKATRLAILAIAVALVLVPTIKRAQQHVEHRDATRLSIKHNWIGVAPPTKATLSQQQILTLPAIGAELDPPRVVAARRPAPTEPVRHPVLDLSPDPLRGPPSLRS